MTVQVSEHVTKRSDKLVALSCGVAVGGMLCLSYAAVPLYRMFCQVTGFGGTTQRAEKAPDVVLDRQVTVRFDANVVPGMPWKFEPVVNTMSVKIGESSLAFYRATNTAHAAVTGTAAFNVSPDATGKFFSKIECFCFKEQTLQAGETVELPVSFFIDPSIEADRDARGTKEITLSYTFYPTAKTADVGTAEAMAKAGGG